MENIKHIGIICDGNGRWAKQRFLPRFIGHQKGAKNIRNIIEWSLEYNIKHLSLFACSTENLKRHHDEVMYLLKIFTYYLYKTLDYFTKYNIRFVLIGDKSLFPEDVRKKVNEIEEKTKNNTRLTVNVAYNYGGRQDILNACNELIKRGVKEVTMDDITKNLYAKYSPNMDILIRTSGEKRVSNFMLWHLAYAELFFIKNHFPDFSKEDFINILNEFNSRNRRFGVV